MLEAQPNMKRIPDQWILAAMVASIGYVRRTCQPNARPPESWTAGTDKLKNHMPRAATPASLR